MLARTSRILTHQRKDKNRLYALHAPEAGCIGKDKARTPYEFGMKVSIVTTLKEGLVISARSTPPSPHDASNAALACDRALGARLRYWQ